MNRAIFLVIAALVLPLSGCLKSETNDDPEPTTGGQVQLAPMPMDVHDCKFIMAVVPVESESLAKYIPEGFRPLAPGEHPLEIPADARGDAMLGIEAEDCERGRQMDGSYAPVQTGSYWIPVVPPEWWMERGAEFYIIKLDMLIWDEHAAADLKSMGLPARVGGATFTEAPTSTIPIVDQPYSRDRFGMNAYRIDFDM